MYLNPSWSPAHSAFAVALFLWYWHKTRGARSRWEWLILALIAGLMLNVYYANAMVLFVLVAEGLSQYLLALRRDSQSAAENPRVSNLLVSQLLFAFTLLVCLLPTFLTRYIIYRNAFETGYPSLRSWPRFSPALLSVLFSSNHGLLSWTPILLFSILGLFIFWHRALELLCWPHSWPFTCSLPAARFGMAYLHMAVVISFLSHLFSFSASQFFSIASPHFSTHAAWHSPLPVPFSPYSFSGTPTMFQWGSHLIPVRGPISFSEMIHDQFFVVPSQLSATLKALHLQAQGPDEADRAARHAAAQRKSSDSLILLCPALPLCYSDQAHPSPFGVS